MTDERIAEKKVTTIKTDLAARIQEELGQNVFLCYQCVKCSGGCPVSSFFDWQPNQIMRAVQLGQEDVALDSETPWLCASCQTCATRCPQDLDIPAIMDFLTRESVKRGKKPAVPVTDAFNKSFMREVRLWGRMYELGMLAELKLRTLDFTSDLDLGAKLFAKNKFKFLPHREKPPRDVKPVPDADTSIAYYPGCSLHSTGEEYDISTREVCKALGLTLKEPEGWICCGSSAAHRSDPDEAIRLPMENLALVEKSGFDEVTMPCAACFSRHKFAQYEIRHDAEHKEKAEQAIEYAYQDKVEVNTLIDTILNRISLDELAQLVKKPLDNLKVVTYYGCLLTRPPEVTEAENPENPVGMDKLMEAMGAEVIDWSYKTTCCGAAHSLTRPDIVLELSGNLIKHAREVGAEAMVIACPLCHTNLDARQFQMKLKEPMPVLYFTQMMAIALGLSEKEAALKKNLIDPRPLLKEKGLL
ncbi:MAG: heterodisulfide reductase-related iron-sulfur binding cluster [Anaerolineales bacterium]|jgi:heterodisulfide reductase subunit B